MDSVGGVFEIVKKNDEMCVCVPETFASVRLGRRVPVGGIR